MFCHGLLTLQTQNLTLMTKNIPLQICLVTVSLKFGLS